MRKTVIVGALFAVFITAALLSDAHGTWYWVKCKRVMMGTGSDGRAAYCTKCELMVREHRGRSPGPEWNAYLSHSEAVEAMEQDDCPN